MGKLGDERLDGGEADGGKRLVHPVLPFGLAAGVVDHQRFLDDLGHVHKAVDAGIGVLEDGLGAAAEGLDFLLAEGRDVLAVEPHRAAGRLDDAQRRLPQRRFTAPRLSDDGDGLLAVDREREVGDGADLGAPEEALTGIEGDVDVVQAEQRRGGALRWAIPVLTRRAHALCGRLVRRGR